MPYRSRISKNSWTLQPGAPVSWIRPKTSSFMSSPPMASEDWFKVANPPPQQGVLPPCKTPRYEDARLPKLEYGRLQAALLGVSKETPEEIVHAVYVFRQSQQDGSWHCERCHAERRLLDEGFKFKYIHNVGRRDAVADPSCPLCQDSVGLISSATACPDCQTTYFLNKDFLDHGSILSSSALAN